MITVCNARSLQKTKIIPNSKVKLSKKRKPTKIL